LAQQLALLLLRHPAVIAGPLDEMGEAVTGIIDYLDKHLTR
jgi:hypothetical protein